MTDHARDRTGPLSAIQIEILGRAISGGTYAEIGDDLVPRKSKGHVAQIMMSAVAKMGCRKVTDAVGKYATYIAYLDAAELLEADINKTRLGASDDQVNAVLECLALILRDRAAKLLPQ